MSFLFIYLIRIKPHQNSAAHTDEQRRVKSTPSSSSFTFCNRIWYQIRNFTAGWVQRTHCMYSPYTWNNTLKPYSLRCKSLPKRLCSRAMVLQFHRWFLNWCWHSPIQFLIPAPIACITLGCWRHNWRCLLINPGMLSHITCDPRVPMYLHKRWKHREWAMGISESHHVSTHNRTFISFHKNTILCSFIFQCKIQPKHYFFNHIVV